LTGPITRAPAPAGEKPAVTAPPTRKRLLLLGAGTLTLVIAAALAFVLSANETGEPQSRTPAPSMSPAASTPSAAPAASTAPSAPATRPETSTATTPAGTTATSPQAQQSTPPTTATMPILYGWRESEVTSEMTRLGLTAHITYRATPDKCYAIEQTPPGGTVLPRGSTVEVVIATATGICKQV
jgi:hypothetical protein